MLPPRDLLHDPAGGLPGQVKHDSQVYIPCLSKLQKLSRTEVPWRIISEYSVELSYPLCNIFNTGTLNGEWPNIWKFEYVTPAPKVYPPATKDDLRKISGTKNFSKIYEALLSETILSDMSARLDKSQY